MKSQPGGRPGGNDGGTARASGEEGEDWGQAEAFAFVQKLDALLDRRGGRSAAQRTKDLTDLAHLERFIRMFELPAREPMRQRAYDLLAEKVHDQAVRAPMAAFIAEWRGAGGEYEFRPSRGRRRR